MGLGDDIERQDLDLAASSEIEICRRALRTRANHAFIARHGNARDRVVTGTGELAQLVQINPNGRRPIALFRRGPLTTAPVL